MTGYDTRKDKASDIDMLYLSITMMCRYDMA